jgi:hypothetical protein
MERARTSWLIHSPVASDKSRSRKATEVGGACKRGGIRCVGHMSPGDAGKGPWRAVCGWGMVVPGWGLCGPLPLRRLVWAFREGGCSVSGKCGVGNGCVSVQTRFGN